MAINRQDFIFNPTNCGVLATETALDLHARCHAEPLHALPGQRLQHPPLQTQVQGVLQRQDLQEERRQPAREDRLPSGAQANIHSVVAQLPTQLPARLTTLQKSCPAATFNANPFACPSGSRVGGATVTTPVLPAKLTGPAFLSPTAAPPSPTSTSSSNGNGIEVILVATPTSSRVSPPPPSPRSPTCPISGFDLNLPLGANSALAPNGNLCAQPLTMPTTITAQSGAVIKQNTKIAVSGCGVKVTSHKVSGHTAILTVQVPAAGRVSGTGPT